MTQARPAGRSAQGRYLFEPAAGEVIGEVVPDDRVTGDDALGDLVEAQPAVRAVAVRATSTTTACPTRLYFADFADRVSVTSQKTLPQEAGLVASYGPVAVVARAQSFQTLQDPNPDAAVMPPYNMLPQVKAALAESDWLGPHVERHRRVHALLRRTR